MLEEESLAELEQKSSKHIRFTLSDTAQASRLLECNFHETHFSIQDDHNQRLHNLDLSVGKIVTAFVENGMKDYFLLWQNDKAVIVGKYQNTLEEVDQTFVDERGIRWQCRILSCLQ